MYIAIIGGQNGDEGKGKIIHWLVKHAAEKVKRSYDNKPILVQRWQGGANAGHTIVEDNGEMYKLHLVPSGITTQEAFNLIGDGVYLDPRKLMKEIQELRGRGVNVSSQNLGIASKAHITFDYHTAEDQADFNKARHTSTGSGIKQTAVDKFGRVGIRFVEFLDAEALAAVLREKRFPNGMPGTNIDNFVASYDTEREFLKEFIILEQDAIKKYGKAYRIGEGAQGTLLDVDVGMYPGITSSNPAKAPGRPDYVLGVFKLYVSSVGTGDRPFVSRMDKNLETELRELWQERGTTTGKDRELGWFDAVAAKEAIRNANIDYLVGTCGDRLNELGKRNEKVRIVTAYKINGKVYSEWDVSFDNRFTLQRAEPVLEELESWTEFSIDGQLTKNAQRYLDRLQDLLRREFIMFGTGPKQNDMLVYKDLLA